MSNVAGVVVGVIFAILVFIFIVVCIIKAIRVVREKEVMVIERLGKFEKVLPAGVHFIIPFIERPKTFWYRYFLSSPTMQEPTLNEAYGLTKISTQNQVLDFPKQFVITRDNAHIAVDAVLCYRIVNPKLMIYSVQNLPLVLSNLLQAQLRNVVGNLDIDQIVEESGSLNVLTGLLDNDAIKWGVKIEFIKVQKIEAFDLNDVLAQKKNADLRNKEIIIGARAKKQTMIIESEGQRDSAIRQAEGQAQERVSKAKGEAQALVNIAKAEAKTIREMAVALGTGKEVTEYLLSTKYIEALHTISKNEPNEAEYLPQSSSDLQTMQNLGINTIFPGKLKTA